MQLGISTQNKRNLLLVCWTLSGGGLLLASALSIPTSSAFGYQRELIDMPLMALFAALFVVALPFVAYPLLIDQTLSAFEGRKNRRTLILLMLAVGLLARAAMLFGDPLMEDDYQRYMWDGALVANGHNPYLHSPKAILDGASGNHSLDLLGMESGEVLGRVNHPSLRTIYPPVAQLGFALAYKIKPFSLTTWRLLALSCELISLALLLSLLKSLGRPRLWSMLYWWNPLVIKELMNAGHMEVLLVPLLLGALWAALRRAPVLTAFLLALAVGVKIWPGLLAPLYLRSLLATPKKLIMPLIIFTVLVVAMFWPVLLAGLDQSSGFVAYSERWKTNSALTPALEALLRPLAGLFSTVENVQQVTALSVRLLIVLALAALGTLAAWRPPKNGLDLAHKTLFITAMMFLLSPAQLPWYAIWFIPFMVFRPLVSLALLIPALQLYYLSFYMHAHEISGFYEDMIVWIIWIPVWLTLAYEAKKLSLLSFLQGTKK